MEEPGPYSVTAALEAAPRYVCAGRLGTEQGGGIGAQGRAQKEHFCH